MDFFATLNFSSTNEDGTSEIAVLRDARRIVCLTGTGTRVLDLLITDAAEIIALDSNPVQNALLALKVAAIAAFERAECLAFLGIAPAADRRERYRTLRPRLDETSRAFWDQRSALIAAGVWHAGQWERLLRWNARFLAVFRPGVVARLMAARTIAEQAGIWDRHFAATGWRARVEALGRDIVWRAVMREPAAAFLPPAREVAARIQADFARAARSFRFADSDIATLALRGRHQADGPLPVHLRAENYDRVRDGLVRLRPLAGDLADLGRLVTGACDGFSLSDFGSYCGPGDYARSWQGVLAAAAPGAAFCERIFMNEAPPPDPRIRIDPALSAALPAADRSIIYRIRAGTIGQAAP